MRTWRKIALLAVAPTMALVTGPLGLAPVQAAAHGQGSAAAESTAAKTTAAESTAAKTTPAKTPAVESAAAESAQLFTLENVLVFSKTAGFRHSSIEPGIAAIEQLGAANGFNVDATEDATQFTDANLAQYDAVVFLSTTGDVLDETQQAAFERYFQAGGGFVGIHAAADTEYTWGWYGEMLGGYFRNHPPGTPTASVDIEDPDEPSTTGLPTRWTRTDEWYNYQSPVNPIVGGGGVDFSPRDSGVHVLATVDESTYDEQDGNATDDDHPIAWCTDFDGGRAWYTGMGHTDASFSEPEFMQHVLGGIRTATRAVPADCGEPRQATPGPEDFEKVTIDDDTQNPFELDVAQDGRVFFTERDGAVRVWSPDTQQTLTAGTIPVYLGQENGLIGMQLAPDFEQSGWIYLAYSALPQSSLEQRVSRFKVVGNTIDMDSEQVILTWTHQRDECCHSSGALYFGPDGSLYVSTGDNTNPFASDGFAPIDERPGRQAWDAQRTSANSNNLNGKFLRVVPIENIAPGTEPGVGTTYTIPDGNLFPAGTAQTRPEIFAMGFRNPFRFTVDSQTGWVLVGDYGPDAGATVAGKGPQGSVEFNAVTSAGNYGWPYCVRQNTPYHDADFSTTPITYGAPFNCANPVNESPNNTGQTNLPTARPATMWMGYTEADTRFPGLGTGGAPTGGPRYHYDPSGPPSQFPEYYDGEWFIGEWNNGWIKHATLDGEGNATDVRQFPYLGASGCQQNAGAGGCYKRPMDIDFGPDGSLYLIEWGSGFGGNNADSGVYRIDYVGAGRRPVAHVAATPTSGQPPLEVTFSSEGSIDPDGTSLTYEWDFGDGSPISNDVNPIHTYTAAGTYTASLRVTDQAGQTGVDNIQIVVGNTAPEVTIDIPEHGQFAEFGDEVPYEITVTDAEDGSTTDGTIECADVTLNISLGHDEHAHEVAEQTGCSGTFETLNAGGHGEGANTFTVIEAVYTDQAQAGGAGAITGRDEALLRRKRQQAEFFTSTGRAPGAVGGGDPGVQTETTTDTGGGLNIGFIENGDYVSFDPMNLKDITSLRFRVASAGAGGTIEIRADAPDGPLVAETPTIAPTGGWQTWTNVDLPLTSPTAGTHELFFVFRHPTDQGGLMNLNWIQFVGKGAATTAAPEVTASADPTTGQAPLAVEFTADATDPEGGALTYAWDFGVAGTGDDTSTEQNPTYTYQQPGTYTASVTATDPDGGEATATVEVRVTGAGGQCPTGVRSDEFDGDALDTNRWTVIRPDATRPPTVSGGNLNFPIDNGSIYGPGTSARNIVVQPLPSGDVEVTAKITTDPLTENYHQAGLRVYSDDDNWASVHMIHAGGVRDFEFIYESNGNPRNEAADKLGGIPDQSPLTYWVRIVSDGQQLTAFYSFDGTEFLPVGRPASLATFTNPRIGPAALSDQAPSFPVARFDWIRFNPDSSSGGGGSGFSDAFDGSSLDKTRWDAIVRDVPSEYTVAGGQLTITTSPGDIYTGDTNPPPNNFILQDASHAGEDWTIETKLSGTINGGYGQGGLIAYQDGDNYVKLDPISDAGNTRINRIELRSEVGGVVANPQDNIDVPEGTTDYWLRLSKTGTSYTGEYSFDGVTWTAFPAPVENPMASPDFGLFAFGPQAEGQGDTVSFDQFLLNGEVPGGECGCSGDEFDGTSLDTTRWNGIVREDDTLYNVSNGALNVTTVNGDIYTDGDPASTRNFFLQTPDHAGEDWVIETRVDAGELSGGYEQAGLLAYIDDDTYVKYDIISDDQQTTLNRIELRSEVNGAIQEPQPQLTPLPAGTEVVSLRLTKTGNMYSGEYSFDGTTWTSLGPAVPNDMAAPRFGLFTLGVNSGGGTAHFEYFSVDGSTGCPGQEPENRAPVIDAASADPSIGFGPLDVDFTVEATDPDEDDLSYSWDLDGDGVEDSTEQNPTRTFTDPGEYAPRVEVSDGELTVARTLRVQVLEPDDAEASFRTLVFSKTAGFRHSSIDEGHTALEQLGDVNGFQVDHTEDATAFRTDVLSHYDTVVFLSTTGDVLDAQQQTAFEEYVRGGGGYTGIHSASDTEYDWTWYGNLVGAYFRNHPANQTATVHVEDDAHPSAADLPRSYERLEEWYNFKSPDFAEVGEADFSPRGTGNIHVLATVDESTYSEEDGNTRDDDHPVTWCQRYDGGRSWYTAMGHVEESYVEAEFLAQVLGGLETTAGVAVSATCGARISSPSAPSVQVSADPASGSAPLSVNFRSTAVDADGGTLTYAWRFGDGTRSTERNPRHVYSEPGTYTATLFVTDDEGDVGTAARTITVAAGAPPEVVATASPTSGNAPLRVRFAATADDPDGPEKRLRYAWDFGDGETGSGSQTSHRYRTPGVYTATVTVTDEQGLTGSVQVRITVNP
jgi:cytochrome c